MPLKFNKPIIENKINSNNYFELKDVLNIENLIKEIENSIQEMTNKKTLYLQNTSYGFSLQFIINRNLSQVENYIISIPFSSLKKYSQKNFVEAQKKQANTIVAKTCFEKKVIRNQKRRQVNFNQQYQPQIKIDMNPSYRIKSSKHIKNKTMESIQLQQKSIESINKKEERYNSQKLPIQSFSIISQQSFHNNKINLESTFQSNFESLNLDIQKLEYQRSIVMEFMPPLENTYLDLQDYQSEQNFEPQISLFELDKHKKQESKSIDQILYLQQKIKENQEILNDWNIDINSLDSNFIYSLLLEIFDPYLQEFKINNEKFYNFLQQLQVVYDKNKNPFHNFYHGVSVCYTAYYYIQNSKFINQNLSKLKIFGFLLAALVHDLGHTGYNNNFEIASKSQIATLYSDKSPLEFHHCAQFFKLIQKNEINILSTLTTYQYKDIRSFIIELIISTDMQQHFTLLQDIEQLNNSEMKNLNEIQITTIMKYLLHSCDLAHTTKKFEITEKLAKQINQEYINQYREEKRLNIPLTQHFNDLENPETFYESEIKFIKGIVQPLFKEVSKILKHKENDLEFIFSQIDQNLKQYKNKLDYYSSNN